MSQSTTPIFSGYTAYVDESGDHSLEIINPYVHCLCCRSAFFRKDIYAETMIPAMRKLKFAAPSGPI